MKKNLLLFSAVTITIQFSLSFNLFAQNVGINTETPQARLHIFKGSSGYVGVYPHQDLIIESNDNTWINLLAPNNKEMGVLFGKPSHIASGGIVYDINNNLHFRTNGNVNRMFLGSNGNVGIGTVTPNAPLSFAAVLGSKITLYPGASGDVGLGVQGNLLQIYSDFAGAAVAFGYGGSNSFHENMRIQGTGDVGIGTSNPVAKLDVTGNVRADEYDYTNPREFWYSIPASAFSSLNSTSKMYKESMDEYNGTLSDDGAYFDYGNGEHNIMLAPVNLPHHAIINQIIVYYYDQSLQFDLHFSLFRKDHLGGYQLMAELETVGQYGGVSPVINNINYGVIDNAAYSYHIRAYSVLVGAISGWPDYHLRIKSIVIRYTLSSAQ